MGRSGRRLLVTAALAVGCRGGAAALPSPRAIVSAELATSADACDRSRRSARRLFAQGHYVDVHLVTLIAESVCAVPSPEIRLLDAAALIELDEGERARGLLYPLKADPDFGEDAAAVLAWSHWRGGDTAAFQRSLAELPLDARRRLSLLPATGDEEAFSAGAAHLAPTSRALVLDAHHDYEAARTKRPWLAGAMSALVPGAGQVYAGSLEGGALALVLNALTIGSTIELARRDLYWSASLVGITASIFYVGNVLNAADLARRRNDRRSEAALERINQVLVPEIYQHGGAR